MGDKTRGIYEKFILFRTDGASGPGGKHEGCFHFCLDVDHDPFAEPALRAYAQSCREGGYDLLADDIITRLASQRQPDPRPEHKGRFCASYDESKFHGSDCTTREAAVAELICSYDDDIAVGQTIWTGVYVDPPEPAGLGDRFMEWVEEFWYDNMMGDYDDRILHSTGEQERELGLLLNAAFQAWRVKNGLHYHWFTVEQVQPYVVTEEDMPDGP